MSFAKALALLIPDLEGGYELINNPNDLGGATFAGITEHVYKGAVTWQWPPTRELVGTFYNRFFWIPGYCFNLPEPADSVLFQLEVNVGVKRGLMLLQAAVGAFPDGIFGPKTLAATQVVSRSEFPDLILAAQEAHYVDVARDWDLNGLYARVIKVKQALAENRI